jgi:hypothetical protein
MVRVTPRRLRGHLIGDDHGPPVPALVGSLVDVAVITRQIAAAVNLQDDLAERNQRPAHAGPSS